MTIHRLPLRNNAFFALRHGQSKANVKGIICSDPSIAISEEYGLSDAGRRQAQQAGRDVMTTLKSHPQYKGLCILSSDFSRAKETAEAVQAEYASQSHRLDDGDLPPLYQRQVVTDIQLRERWFGDYDMQNDSNYQLVWDKDATDSSHTFHQVESVDSVRRRASQVVDEYDALLQDHMIVLVAHGDVLQILQTGFLNIKGSEHRTLDHLETAKMRRMDVTVASV
jgi:broad specificity phosphatase PhoE